MPYESVRPIELPVEPQQHETNTCSEHVLSFLVLLRLINSKVWLVNECKLLTTLLYALPSPNGLTARGMSWYATVFELSHPH